MELSFAHVTNELRRAGLLVFKENFKGNSLQLWTMTSKLYISIDAIEEYPLFKLCIGVTTKHHTLVYKNFVSVESSDDMLRNLYRCVQKDHNVFSAMKISLRHDWYLKSEKEKEEENERGQFDEIVDYLFS